MNKLWIWLCNLLGISYYADKTNSPKSLPEEGPAQTPIQTGKVTPPIAHAPSVVNSAPSGNSIQKMSDAGLAMTKYCEGLFLHSYQDSGGTWTIGYGRILYDNGLPVGPNETCTIEEAEKWLLEDVDKDGGHFVRAWCKNPLPQNQFDALADFSFNAGAGVFHKLLNLPGNLANNIPDADPNKILGRLRRRQMNKAMYLGQSWEVFKEWKP